MNIRFFILGCSRENADKSLDLALHNVFSEYLADNEAVEYYSFVRDATVSIGKAVASSQVVVFFADENYYGEAKKTLCSAFGLTTEIDRITLEMALATKGSFYSEDEEFCNTHCAVPTGTKAIVCDDGLYAGFACVRGNQTLVLLPYSHVRTAMLLANSVIPMLNSTYSVKLETISVRHMYAGYLGECVKRDDVKIALAKTSVYEMFMSYISWNKGLTPSVLVSSRSEERGSVPPSEYVVSQSITAAELMGAGYGIAMTNSFFTGDDESGEKVVYMAVTSTQQTIVREVYSLPNEELSTYMTRCCGELCRLITQIMDNETGICISPKAAAEKRAVRKYKKMIAVVLFITLLIAGAGILYFGFNNYSLKDWYNNHIGTVLQKEQTSVTTQIDSTTDITTEAGA